MIVGKADIFWGSSNVGLEKVSLTEGRYGQLGVACEQHRMGLKHQEKAHACHPREGYFRETGDRQAEGVVA